MRLVPSSDRNAHRRLRKPQLNGQFFVGDPGIPHRPVAKQVSGFYDIGALSFFSDQAGDLIEYLPHMFCNSFRSMPSAIRA